MRNQAYRRHQKIKRRKKAERFVNIVDGNFGPYYNEEMRNKLIQVYTEDPKPCSCFICGNYRKHYGQTLKECKADIDFKEQLNEN